MCGYLGSFIAAILQVVLFSFFTAKLYKNAGLSEFSIAVRLIAFIIRGFRFAQPAQRTTEEKREQGWICLKLGVFCIL